MQRTTIVSIATLVVACAGSTTQPTTATTAPSPASTVAAGIDPVPPPRDDGRLPNGAHPTRYALDVKLDPSKTTFVGRARIGITIDKPLRASVLHARSMQITRATLHAAHGDLTAKPD